jgi:site-specific recombinase XerD
MDRSEAIEQFRRYLQRRAPGRRTAIDYTSDVRQFAGQCSRPWREVSMQDIDAFVDQQHQTGRSAATVKRRVAALHEFFEFLIDESQDDTWFNPVHFKRHAGKQPQHLPRDLKDDEIEQLGAVITHPRDRAWFALMLRGGLRVGEVVNLTLPDLLAPPRADQPARLRVRGKGQKERLVLLTADAYAVLQQWLAQRPLTAQAEIFLNERGQPLTASGIEWLLHRYGEQTGLALTPHQLRHTYARQLTEAGMPVTSLSKLLGHAQITTTQIYTAGADPALAQAYQSAMAQQAAATPLAAPHLAPQPLGDQPRPEIPPAAPPALPDWATWAPHLPAALRQASLDLVQHRLPNWPPRRQRLQALQLLGELRRFWDWLASQRVVSALNEIHLADLAAYQEVCLGAGLAAHTADCTLSYVLAAVRLQADKGQDVDASLFRLRMRPRPESLPRHLTDAESQQLESWVQDRLPNPDPQVRLENACFFVLAHGGLRASECVALTFQDLDLPGRRLTVRQGKGLKDRTVYLTDTACLALAGYLTGTRRSAQAPLFTYPNGRPISYAWLWQRIVALGQAAGVAGVAPHRLRHTLATRLLNAGMPITGIQKLLGHRFLNTTMIYARVADPTVEHDYRRAMCEIERQQMPLSDVPVAIPWFQQQPDQVPTPYNQLDNSV